MKKTATALAMVFLYIVGNSQSYTSFFTGNSTDLVTQPIGGVCLMGGAGESDEAMIWFLERAAGGDVVVLRATGSDGYNDYMYLDLGVNVNSVETIRFNSIAASSEQYIIDKINQAEALWFAGGDQWDYITYWRNNAIGEAINNAVNVRNAVIGGLSAGMAIQGDYYFSAQNGTITSEEAIANPYAIDATVDGTPFLENASLANTITDTHFDSPDRRGRISVFLGRMLEDFGIEPRAIACDEYTAVCIDENSIARIFGEANELDYAYFVQRNCAIENNVPESLSAGQTFEWNQGGEALTVYRVRGNEAGNRTFDLNTWTSGVGGEWLYWSVSAGQFVQTPITQVPDCLVNINEQTEESIVIYPNPASEFIQVDTDVESLWLYNMQGQLIQTSTVNRMNVRDLPAGIYNLHIRTKDGKDVRRTVKKRN
jgi:cyanophycinase-like exopeptidase